MLLRKIVIFVLYALGAFIICQKLWSVVFTSKKQLNYHINKVASNYAYPIHNLSSGDYQQLNYHINKVASNYTYPIHNLSSGDYQQLNYHINKVASNYTYPIHNLSSGDYQQLIDLKNFSFGIFNEPCKGSDDFLLLVLIHSRFDNFAKRMVIRDTWGKNNKDIKVLFVIASNDNQSVRKTLQEENVAYGDLLEGSFNDNYRNMTYKHVMVFKYVIYHCSQAKYILKTDDDVFVNMPLMMHFLQIDLSPFGCTKLLFCSLRTNSKVFRSWRSKWRVSFQEYREKFYPPYCPGWAILYSPDVLFDLYKEAQQSHYFWIDDVLITGVIAKKLNLSHTNSDSLVLSKFQSSYPSTISKSFLYGYPGTTIPQIKALWSYALNQNLYVSLLNKLK